MKIKAKISRFANVCFLRKRRSKPPGLLRHDHDVILCGWPASGSTFLYQALKMLGYGVRKEHGFVSGCGHFLKLFTIRDPRDVLVSNAKRLSRQLWDEGRCEEALQKELLSFVAKGYRQAYYSAVNDPATLVIRYELFMPEMNEALLIRFVADQLGISFSKHELDHLLQETSISRNKERSRHYDSFSQWDKEWQIHGNHITSNGNTGNWLDVFTPDLVSAVNKELGPLIRDLGYKEDSI